MFSTSIMFMSGLFFSAFPLAFWPIIGFASALRTAQAFFLSIGMIMFFQAWLQFINFDGSWPTDQPFVDVYEPGKAETARVDGLVRAGSDDWSRRDWDDYHRCLQHNVCVRRFAR